MTNPRIVDLEWIVTKWCWEQFKLVRERESKELRFKDLFFDIKWDKVAFSSGEPNFSDKTLLPQPHNQMVFRSVFENHSAETQDYNFNTERWTVSKCITNITEGFTRGFNLALQLGTPYEVLTGTAGYGREVTMQKSRESETEIQVMWGINTTVKVPSKHRTIAEMMVKEQEFKATFRMEVQTTGHVVVTVFNRFNNGFLMFIENDLSEIVRSALADDCSHFRVDGKTLIWNVGGNCTFRYGLEQHVLLRESPLSTQAAITAA